MNYLSFLKLVRPKLILSFLIVLNLIFIFVFEIFLKQYFLDLVSNDLKIIDQVYYKDIFNNLSYSALYLILILLVVFILINHLKKLFEKLTINDYTLLILLIINCLIQILILLFVHTLPISDSVFYIQHAERLYRQGSYVSEYGFYTAFWPVGLPALIALFKHFTENYILITKVFNILVSTGLIFLLFSLFKEYLTKKQQLIFLLSFVLFPNHLFSVNVILTDFAFTLLLWLIIFLTIKKYDNTFSLVITGLLIGLVSYLRPNTLLIPILIFSVLLFNSINMTKVVVKTILVLFVATLIILPWQIRNYKVYGRIISLSTNGGFNFLMGNHINTSGKVNFDFEYQISNPNEADEEAKAYKRAFEHIVQDPIRALIRIPKKIFYSYYRGDSSITWSLKHTHNYISPSIKSFVFYLTNFMFYLIIIISIYSFLKNLMKSKLSKIDKILFTIFIIFILTIVVYVGNERYIIPIIPIHFYYFSKYF